IFHYAVRYCAARIVLAHNHPSGIYKLVHINYIRKFTVILPSGNTIMLSIIERHNAFFSSSEDSL
ncbi:TPA: hypothetical protein IXG71_002786, partial [Enterococcus faecium]|nr:hypothetical protein [Enterococcus faecium]